MLFAIFGAIWTVCILCITFLAIYLYKLHRNHGASSEYTWDAPRLWMLYILGISICYLGTARLASSLSGLLMHQLNQQPIPLLLPEQWINLAGICAVIAFMIGLFNRGERSTTTHLYEIEQDTQRKIAQKDPLLLPELRQLPTPVIHPEDANTYLESENLPAPVNILDNRSARSRNDAGLWRTLRNGLVPSFVTTMGVMIFMMSALFISNNPNVLSRILQIRTASEPADSQPLAIPAVDLPASGTLETETLRADTVALNAVADSALDNIALGAPADVATGNPADFMQSDPSNLLVPVRTTENASGSVASEPVGRSALPASAIDDKDSNEDGKAANGNMADSALENIALGVPADFALGNPTDFMNSDPANLPVPTPSTESAPVSVTNAEPVDQAPADQATTDQATTDQATTDQSAADQSAADQSSVDATKFYTTSIPITLVSADGAENQSEPVETLPSEIAPKSSAKSLAVVQGSYDVNARFSPSEDSAIIALIPSGKAVPIEQWSPNGEWILVTLEDGRSAWIAARVVKVITPTL